MTSAQSKTSQSALFTRYPDLTSIRWVFAYGSLVWNPEFQFRRKAVATVYGWHRAFCVSSTRYRGTAQKPGVVLGLDRGGCVQGIAYELRARDRIAALTGVMEREMPSERSDPVYLYKLVTVHLAHGEHAQALTFVADRSRASYIHLTEAQMLQRLRRSIGQRGPNREYAINTWQALQHMGLHDHRLARLAHLLQSS
jgi:glutathione-specific gamma-glutamylcyclotransferase